MNGTVIEGSPALNRVSWTASGQNVAVGDSLGKVWLYDIGEVRFLKLSKKILKFLLSIS